MNSSRRGFLRGMVGIAGLGAFGLGGCAAQQVPGVLNWNSSAQKFDVAAANAIIRPNIRKGFEF